MVKGKEIKVFIFILVAVLALGVGYAAISSVTLNISGNADASANQENFKVHFVGTPTITSGLGEASINSSDDTQAMINVSNLSNTGDKAIATYNVKNDSKAIGAKISLSLVNTNTEYFRVSQHIADTELKAGDQTVVTITVELLKTPLEEIVTTNITCSLLVSPVSDDEASLDAGGVVSSPSGFAMDSWEEIQYNIKIGNVSQYSIGDTKNIMMDDKIYTLRIANKGNSDGCSMDSYSETTCGFVVEFTDIVEKRRMNSGATNAGSWPATELHNYLQIEFYNKLPADLKKVIVNTKVVTPSSTSESNLVSSNDKIFLPSVLEVFGGGNTNETSSSYSAQLEYYKDNGTPGNLSYGGGEIVATKVAQLEPSDDNPLKNEKAIKMIDGNIGSWWLRSASASSVEGFNTVDVDARISHSAVEEHGVSPMFRIG